MVPAGQLAAFATASSILIVIPGPSVLFTVGHARAYGNFPAHLAADGRRAQVALRIRRVPRAGAQEISVPAADLPRSSRP